MSHALAIAAILVAGAIGERAEGGRVALTVSPARIAVTGPASHRIVLRNVGTDRVVVDADRRPLGWRTAARTWLKISPAQAVVRSGGRAIFTVRVRPPPRAEPGDHQVLVRLTTRPPRDSRVGVRMRLAVRVRLRIPGRVVRRIVLRGIRVERRRSARVLLVSVANRGNVSVPLARSVTLALRQHGRLAARVRPRRTPVLLPRTRAVLPFRYRGRVRGLVTVVVRVRLGRDRDAVTRRFHLRL
jgi:hypothetical protein